MAVAQLQILKVRRWLKVNSKRSRLEEAWVHLPLVALRGTQFGWLTDSDIVPNVTITKDYISCGLAAEVKHNCSWLSILRKPSPLKNNVNLAQNIILDPSSSTTLALHACTQASCRPPNYSFLYERSFLMQLEGVHRTFHKQKSQRTIWLNFRVELL